MNIFEIIFLIPFNPFYENNYIFYSKFFTPENFTIDRALSIISIVIAIFIASFIYYKQKQSQEKSDEILDYINVITNEINDLVTLQSIPSYYHKNLFVHNTLDRLLKLKEKMDIQLKNIDSFSDDPSVENVDKINKSWREFRSYLKIVATSTLGVIKLTKPYLNDPTLENRFQTTFDTMSMGEFDPESVLDTYPPNMKYEPVRNQLLYDLEAIVNLIDTVKEEEKITEHLRDITLRLRYYFNQNS